MPSDSINLFEEIVPPPDHFEKPFILLVDDRPENLVVLMHTLEDFDVNFVTANSGNEALKMILNQEFALILMDVQMPELDGFETAEIMRRRIQTPIIFVTALSREEQQVFQGYASGAVDYLFKPIQSEILKSKVQVFLTLYTQSQVLKASNQILEKRIMERTLELNRLNQTFQRFVPKPFLDRILDETFQPGQFEEESLTILFSDIRSYTKQAEQMTPEENFQFLHNFFEITEPVIGEHQGFVDKFIGDGIMALFNGKHTADNAIKAALAMQAEIGQYNEKRRETNLPPIHVGVGINTGKVMMGSLGSSNRLSSTVIGDAVNLSSRVEELTKRYHARILISEYTHDALEEPIEHIREIDTVRVRGRTQTVKIYEVFSADPLPIQEKKLNSRHILLEGIQLYKAQQFDEAIGKFQECLKFFSQDGVVFEYILRCHYFKKFPPKDSWNEGSVQDTRLLMDHTIRRQATRISFKVKVDLYHAYTYDGLYQEEPLVAFVTNLSVSGMQLELEQPLIVGNNALIIGNFENTELEMLVGKNQYFFLGRVMWQEQETDSATLLKAWSIGVQVITIKTEQEYKIHQGINHFIEQLSAK